MSTAKTLAKLKKLKATSSTSTRKEKKVEMTAKQLEQCKHALKVGNRGMNVWPNRYDIAKPYRVSIKYNDQWIKYGEFANVDTAAAVGTLISSAYFGENARAGEFDPSKVEDCAEFIAWLENPKYKLEIARANGDTDVLLPGMKKKKEETTFDSEEEEYDPEEDGENPFM